MSPPELTNYLLLTLLIPVVNACLKGHYDVVPNKHHPGTIMETIPGVTTEACRRVCRMTKECDHFNMLWSSTGDTMGTCVILSPNEAGEMQILEDDTTATYYWSCPGQMTFEPSMNKCYQVITEAMTQPEAMDYCSHMFPGVHLVDLESSIENTFVNNLVEAAAPFAPSYYTSGKNINTSSTAVDPTDFKWLSTDTVILYTNWESGQPYRPHIDHICVSPIKIWGWKWNDLSCLRSEVFVCEMH